MMRAPKELADRPAAKSFGEIDVLSDLLDTLRLATFVPTRLELGAPWGIELPDDDVALLLAVVRGAARLEPEAARRPRYLAAGDVVLLPHGGAHRLRDAAGSALHRLGAAACTQTRALEPIRLGGAGPPAVILACRFRFRAAHRTHAIQRLARCIHLGADQVQDAPWLAAAVQLLAMESSSRRPGAAIIMNRLADILLIQTIRLFIAGSACHSHSLRALADPQIGEALALIHQRVAEPWTVERLASEVALSRSGFAARFSELVGEPPLAYLARWRITRAAQLLRDTDLATAEIAARAGYRSEAAFHRAFKRLEGVPPGAYRRRRRAQPAL